MKTKIENMTPKEIRLAGYEALKEKLGVVGMIRFMQDIDKGYGDYTKDRHKWLGNPDLDEIANEIKKKGK